MKTNKISKGSENLNEVSVMDATTTKSGKKGGKKESANEMKTRSKSEILSELRALFEIDLTRYTNGLKDLANDFLSGKISALQFDKQRAEFKKSCIPDDITSVDEFLSRKGVNTLIAEICNLYGCNFERVLDIILVREPEGVPSIKIYSKDQNEGGTLIAENNLYFRLDDLSASVLIAGIAGAGVFLNDIRVRANKQANDKKQATKSVDDLLKRGFITAEQHAEMIARINA